MKSKRTQDAGLDMNTLDWWSFEEIAKQKKEFKMVNPRKY